MPKVNKCPKCGVGDISFRDQTSMWGGIDKYAVCSDPICDYSTSSIRYHDKDGERFAHNQLLREWNCTKFRGRSRRYV